MQNDFAGQNAFDLAGGINLTMFQGKNGSAGIQILSTGVSLNNGGGYNGFAITGGYNSQTGTEQVGWNGTSTLNDFGNEAASIGSGIASGISAAAGAIGSAANFVYNGVSGAVSALASTIPPAGNNAASAAFEGTPADQTEEMKKLNAASNYGIDVKDLTQPMPGTTAINPVTTPFNVIANEVSIPQGSQYNYISDGNTSNITGFDASKIPHTVQSGETLANIASDNGITLDQLLTMNPGLATRENYITPGMVLNMDPNKTFNQQATSTQIAMSNAIGQNFDASQKENATALVDSLIASDIKSGNAGYLNSGTGNGTSLNVSSSVAYSNLMASVSSNTNLDPGTVVAALSIWNTNAVEGFGHSAGATVYADGSATVYSYAAIDTPLNNILAAVGFTVPGKMTTNGYDPAQFNDFMNTTNSGYNAYILAPVSATAGSNIVSNANTIYNGNVTNTYSISGPNDNCEFIWQNNLAAGGVSFAPTSGGTNDQAIYGVGMALIGGSLVFPPLIPIAGAYIAGGYNYFNSTGTIPNSGYYNFGISNAQANGWYYGNLGK